LFRELAEKIDENSLIDLTKELIKIPSFVTGIGEGSEKEIANFIAKTLSEAGFETHLQEVTRDRPNVVGIMRGTGGGSNLMLNGHLDTIETHGMKIDPFGGRVQDGRIYGRGASDMKGALAAMIIAAKTIKESGLSLKGDLIISGCADEEGKGMGGEYLAKSGLKADMAVVGEPTELDLAIAQKGLTFIDIAVEGKAAHGSSPEKGKNAILVMNEIINRLNSTYLTELNRRQHPLLGKPTLNIGFIEGGFRPNVVADFCRISIDRRIIPGEDCQTIEREINEIIKELQTKDPDIKVKVDVMKWAKCLPSEISPQETIVKSVSENLRDVTGREPRIIGAPYWTDAGSFVNLVKIPTLIFGPGELEQAHSSSESIPIDKLVAFSKIILLTALDICSREKTKNNT